MKEVVNECGGIRRQLVARGCERAKQRRSRVSERLHQPGVTAQRQVGQARETILHVNQSTARTCLALPAQPRERIPLRSYTSTSHVLP
jgi:hypothetical protein